MSVYVCTQFSSIPEVLGDYHSGHCEHDKSQKQGSCSRDGESRSALVHMGPFSIVKKDPLSSGHVQPCARAHGLTSSNWLDFSLTSHLAEHTCSAVCSCPE